MIVPPLGLARVRDVTEVAWVMALAFTARRRSDRPPRLLSDRALARVALLATILTAATGVAMRQCYYKPRVALMVQRKRGRTVQIAVSLTVGLFSALLLAVGVFLGAALVCLLMLLVGGIAIYIGSDERRAEKQCHWWTRSKRARGSAETPPPKLPTWVLHSLASDPRTKGQNALADAHGTLRALIPSGYVVEVLAGSPSLARIYRRAGFQQWHPTSLRMWLVVQ